MAGEEQPRSSFTWEMPISAAGWTFLEECARAGSHSRQCFVAMSFSDAMRSVWTEAIAPAVRRAGWQPYRVDAEPHNERIDAKIVSEIRNSRFLVADVTEQKNGVYFEAGYAQGMGLAVIWTVREDDLSKVHFDTRQFHHIVWRDAQHLERELFNSITGIIGKGEVANISA